MYDTSFSQPWLVERTGNDDAADSCVQERFCDTCGEGSYVQLVVPSAESDEDDVVTVVSFHDDTCPRFPGHPCRCRARTLSVGLALCVASLAFVCYLKCKKK